MPIKSYGLDADKPSNPCVGDEWTSTDTCQKYTCFVAGTWKEDGDAVTHNTLDEAYDEGGAGSGKDITADSGPVTITASGDNALDLRRDGAGFPDILKLQNFNTPAAGTGVVISSDVYNASSAETNIGSLCFDIQTTTASSEDGRFRVQVIESGSLQTSYEIDEAAATHTFALAGNTTMTINPTNVALPPHGASAGNTMELHFLELAASGTNYVGFKAPDAIGSSQIWVLPDADGSASEVLSTDGSGNLSWVSGGGVTDHGALTGLTDDDHTQYALLAGRSGGQEIHGGTGSGDDLTIQSTSNATKGTIIINEATGVDITPTTAASIVLNPFGASAGNTAEVRWLELAANGTNYVGLKSPDSLGSSTTYVLPSTDGSASDGLITDGSGNLSFGSPTPAAHASTHSDGGSDEITAQNLGSGGATQFQVMYADGLGGWTMSSDYLFNDLGTSFAGRILYGGSTSVAHEAGFEYNSTTNTMDVDNITAENVVLSPTTANGMQLDPFGASAGNTAEVRWLELAANGTNYTGFKAPDSLAGNVIYTLPTADGSSGEVLSTNGSGTLSWASAGASFPEFQFYADQMENPVNSNWKVNALAPASADASNNGLIVRLFDDTTEEGIGFTIRIPTSATNIKFDFVSRAATAPGSAKAVRPKIYKRDIPDNSSVGTWSAGTLMTAIDIPTNANFQYDTQTISLATLGLTADRVTQFEITRLGTDASDTLSGDWNLLLLKVSFT